ncbi:hypothetical protein GCM10010923_24670 [Blastomonas marina]|jgi:hypothetical protein|uniref:DUF2127 domain-containing protein n=1 Tax=Blastomonas marina TaxID=1867408 RepID=A0ABQ1FJ28_9SPHN|nr:hypothetical protein [Blastomonas marina]GGA13001.1 hypothetical protein GCM10010923_24670 [Blastomonas marina]
MRPDSIKKFDLFYLGAVTIELIANFLDRASIAAVVANRFAGGQGSRGLVEGSSDTVAIILIALLAALQLLLWYLVSRRRIGLVRYLVVGVVAINLLGLPTIFAALPAIAPLVALFVLALQLIAVFYLFKAESTIWLKGKRVVDEDDDGHLDGE